MDQCARVRSGYCTSYRTPTYTLLRVLYSMHELDCISTDVAACQTVVRF